MGLDKALHLHRRDGRLLLSYLAGELAARFGETVLLVNDPAKLEPIPDLRGYGRVTDLYPGSGPAGAIYSALAARPGRRFFVMACDQMVIDWDLLGAMLERMTATEAEAVVPRHGGFLEPLYAFYGPGAETVLAGNLNQGLRSIRSIYPFLKIEYYDLSASDLKPGLFDNFNRPEEAARAGLVIK
jgi:molybdopterin-guanine dinucleotide biosynthesis protein A